MLICVRERGTFIYPTAALKRLSVALRTLCKKQSREDLMQGVRIVGVSTGITGLEGFTTADQVLDTNHSFH